MHDTDPLRDYMRVVRKLNNFKIELIAVDRKIGNAQLLQERDHHQDRRARLVREMELLRDEGDRCLGDLRHKWSKQH